MRARLVEPREWGRGPFRARRRSPNVPLYRHGDLVEVVARQDIDWAAVRATPAGKPSLLASLPTGGQLDGEAS